MSQESSERDGVSEGASWPGSELRSIAERVEELRDRLSGLAGELRGLAPAASDGEASRAVTEVQRRTWIVATDLVGAIGRLEVLGRDLRRLAGAEAPPAISEGDAEALVATIECVIADHLDPAIQSLLGPRAPDDGDGSPRRARSPRHPAIPAGRRRPWT
jgi:hypothetical protein